MVNKITVHYREQNMGIRLMVIGGSLLVVSIYMIRKFGRLGLISQRIQSGKGMTYKDIEFSNKQPNWVYDNPGLCKFFGNIAPFLFILSLFLISNGV